MLSSQGIDSASLAGRYVKKDGVPAHQAGNRFLGSLKGLQIPALACEAISARTIALTLVFFVKRPPPACTEPEF